MISGITVKHIQKSIALFFLIVFTSGCNKKQDSQITIAVAANMQFAIKEISKVFTEKTGIVCNIIIGSSGKLTAQIKEGAPYDILMSADMKYPENLYNEGFTTNPPKIYAHGKLILWSTTKAINPDIQTLLQPEIKHIAIANPTTAPYGKAAISTLKHQKVYDQIKDKLVYGESIAQTNQFIISGAAQVGFTSASIVHTTQMKNKGSWISIPENTYTPISQGVVIIKKKERSHKTLQFYDFLFSHSSQEILKNFGYIVTQK